MYKCPYVCLLAVCLVLPTAAWADINLVQNGGFETLGAAHPGSGYTIYDANWWSIADQNSVPTTGVCVNGTCGAPFSPHSGNAAVWGGAYTAAHDNTTSQPSTVMQQSITTLAGVWYNLTFYLSRVEVNGPPITNAWSVTWNGNQIGGATNVSSFPYTQMSYGVTGTGSDQLGFAFFDQNGAFELDDVSLTAPEPGSVSLLVTMLAGVVGLAGVLKKKLT